jgi:hypothetical protein
MVPENSKFLKTIRFDPSDTRVFERPAAPDEWAIPGSFSFVAAQPDQLTGKSLQAFRYGFLSLDSFGRSTFVSVAEISVNGIAGLEQALSGHFVESMGAPSIDVAARAAHGEIEFVIDMCANVAVGSVFSMRRSFDDNGEIREVFRLVDPQSTRIPARAWEVVEE